LPFEEIFQRHGLVRSRKREMVAQAIEPTALTANKAHSACHHKYFAPERMAESGIVSGRLQRRRNRTRSIQAKTAATPTLHQAFADDKVGHYQPEKRISYSGPYWSIGLGTLEVEN
jgi:hypothetical protein